MIKILIIACCLLMAQMATAQTCKDTIPASTPDSRFEINGDEVTDTYTGLIWQRCSLGQTGSDCSGGSAKPHSWQEALQAASAPWRLPNVKELRSIVENKCTNPASNLAIFPNTAYSERGFYWHWSASHYVRYPPYAWYVSFRYGEMNFNVTTDRWNYVRLVRGGQ